MVAILHPTRNPEVAPLFDLCTCKNTSNPPLGDRFIWGTRSSSAGNSGTTPPATIQPWQWDFQVTAPNENFRLPDGTIVGDHDWYYVDNPAHNTIEDGYHIDNVDVDEWSRSVRFQLGAAVQDLLTDFDKFPRWPNSHSLFRHFEAGGSNSSWTETVLGTRIWRIESPKALPGFNPYLYFDRFTKVRPSIEQLGDPLLYCDVWFENYFGAPTSLLFKEWGPAAELYYDILPDWDLSEIGLGNHPVTFEFLDEGDGTWNWNEPDGEFDSPQADSIGTFSHDDNPEQFVDDPGLSSSEASGIMRFTIPGGTVTDQIGGVNYIEDLYPGIIDIGLTAFLEVVVDRTVGAVTETDRQWYRPPMSWIGGNAAATFSAFRSHQHGQPVPTMTTDPRFPSAIRIQKTE